MGCDFGQFVWFQRQEALHVHPNLSRVRRVLLRTHSGVVAPGLLKLREVGFRVFTRLQLRAELNQKAKVKGVASWEAHAGNDDEEHIYALFQTCADASWDGQEWNGEKLMNLIEIFESDVRNKLVTNMGRMSAYPRVLPLREVLRVRI